MRSCFPRFVPRHAVNQVQNTTVINLDSWKNERKRKSENVNQK
ncbi:hypothetical protein HMPREF3216_01072 [Gardnerella vaginalis]|uniref:Uncharacterized protein n=1 Tax=Gardnerella vaginalis TaxID=2702 RepID=A0A133NMZ6_GARVA|nr:hypothetical protein HMPREF3216_01072 [Gardnerella vaginalis]